jgi:hypothetical protein
MAKSGRKYWFQSNIFAIVILVYIICACESRPISESSSTNNNEAVPGNKIINVPQRKNPINCAKGERLDNNGKCRRVW